MQPINLNKRIYTLDYLRGFALLGIILVNIPGLLWIKPPDTSIDFAYYRFLMLFVEGKFFSIFSFLFGLGFYIFISRAKAKNENAYFLFIRRIIILLLIGLIHFYFLPGEMLTIYAIFGSIALPFYKVRKEINVINGLILLAVTAYYGIKIAMPFPLILLGIAACQYRIFEKINDNRKNILIFTVIMLCISIGGLLYQWHYVPDAMMNIDNMTKDELTEYVTKNEKFELKFLLIGLQFSPFVSAFYVGLLILILQQPICQIVLSPLKEYGRMALTNYLGQTALILIIRNAFHLTDIRYIQSLWICISICIFQLMFCKLWLKFFKFGPFEWLWRMGTYWTIPSLIKASTNSKEHS